MPIDKITATEFETEIRDAVIERNNQLDTAYGPIYDAVIAPQAAVFEQQNDRNRYVSLLLSLSNVDQLVDADSDIEAIVFNEGETRIDGDAATATLVFSRATVPTIDIPIQRGYPVGSQPDESTGDALTFLVTETRTMLASQAASYFNLTTQRYELSVPAVAVVTGTQGRVGPNRINRALRPLVGFDSVTNPEASTGGRDRESNSELVARYLLAIRGRQTGTPGGIERVARAEYPGVEDILVVYGDNPLLIRAATDAGAVDAWIKGQQTLQNAENLTYLGVGQLIEVGVSPMIGVVSVASGGTTYIVDDDYEVVFDTSGVSASTRAAEGIRFLTGGSNPLPAVGDVVTVTYTYNNLIRSMQTGFEQPDALELGRDLLFRQASSVAIAHTAQLRVAAGFSPTSVLTAVQNAVESFFADAAMGVDVEGSDIQLVVRAVSGVDNYIITRLSKTTDPTGTADVPIADNEYPTLDAPSFNVTLI